jgi:hypothetical protein
VSLLLIDSVPGILGGPRSVAAWLAYMGTRSLDELEAGSRDEQLSLLEALTPEGAGAPRKSRGKRRMPRQVELSGATHT